MPALNYIQALGEIEKQPLRHRLYLLMTESDYALREVSHLLIDAVVPQQRDFNVARLDCARDTTFAAVMMLTEELPIMEERRLVWVRDVHLMADAQISRLTAYLTELPDTTWLLLSGLQRVPRSDDEGMTDSKGSGMKHLVDAVQKHGLVTKASMSEDEVAQWLQREVKRRGLSASAEACKLLHLRIGEDLTALSTELDKLTCFVAERARVEADDVRALVSATPARRIFDLSDAMARNDASESLAVLTDLLDADEPPLRILAYLATHYRTLIKVKALDETGTPLARIMEITRRSKYPTEKDLRVVRRLSARDLEGAVEAMLRADMGIKRGKDATLLLQLLIMHLCRVARPASRQR